MDQRTHTLVLGDLNFVVKGGDRFTFQGNDRGWQTGSDPEADTWDRHLGDKLSELFQPRMTYQSTTRTSRIDRIYTSLEPTQLVAYETSAWVVDNVVLSDHKPVKFTITLENKASSYPNPWPLWTFSSKHYPERVRGLFQEAENARREETPVQKLNRLLWAMGTAALQVSDRGDTEAAKSPADKLAASKAMLIVLRNNNSPQVEKTTQNNSCQI